MQENLITKIKDTLLSGEYDFEALALDIFLLQYHQNKIYNTYVKALGVQPENVNSLKEIPFLPIEFFKNHTIKTTNFETEKIYKSSGTGEIGRSKHHMSDNQFYLLHAKNLFETFYESLDRLIVAAILPSYLEQGDSSLIAMTDYFINQSQDNLSGYYLGKSNEIKDIVTKANNQNKKIIFLGVTYAMLRMAKDLVDLSGHIVMETGGMKGRGKELVREELHQTLCQGLKVDSIHSEYGMTELTSQAYSSGNGLFHTPKSMCVMVRDINDPFSYQSLGKSGGLNLIDLANVTSCSFLETKDLGKVHDNYQFEVLGRFDNSDLRGCNLLLV